VLPSGRTKDLRALIDCGSTDNFINLNLVEKFNLEILPLKNGCVSLGADTTAQAAGETRPLTMTLGSHCSHRSKSTVIELGDHNIILGRPFLSHVAARVEGDECWIPTKWTHGPTPMGEPSPCPSQAPQSIPKGNDGGHEGAGGRRKGRGGIPLATPKTTPATEHQRSRGPGNQGATL
jgi:hypothetical protein